MSDPTEPLFICSLCDWCGADPIAHEHQRHDGAQTCWHDRAAVLRQFVREHRERLSDPESVAARQWIREWADG